LRQIDHHVANRFKVISSALLDAQVAVDRGVPRRSCEVLVFFVGDMLMGLWVPISLAETEVDEVDDVGLLAQSQ
jgi:hypothetical protein